MAKIKPFKAVRPAADKVHLVASRSYVSYEREKLLEKLDSNPYTFIHIINPDYNQEQRAKGGTPEIFKKVKEKFHSFKEDEILFKDAEDSFYIYQQKSSRGIYTGIIAGVSNQDYVDKVIKIHEATIARREKLFTDYLEKVDFNAEPVLLSHKKSESLSKVVSEIKTSEPIYDFTTSDTFRHTVWRAHSASEIEQIKTELDKIDNLYIADGHHRSASSINLGQLRNNQNPNANSNWFMAMITQENEMQISGFHRLIRGIPKHESDQIIKKIHENFDTETIMDDVFSPKAGEIHMCYFGTGWVKIKLKSSDSKSPTESLDVKKLSTQILSPLAGITDLKNDSRIKFVPDTSDLQSIAHDLDDGNDILFLLAPVTFDQLKAVADADEFMPPKSTYIEPKLRSGLTIFEISDE